MGRGAHQQLPCSPLLGKETGKLQWLAAFLGDKLHAWGSTGSRAALLRLPPSLMQKSKGALVLGCTRVPSAHMVGGSSPHTRAAPRSMWSQAAVPGAMQQARAMGSSGLPVGASPQGAWQHGKLVPGGILCAVTHPSNPKALVASGQGRKRRATLALTAFPAFICATSPGSSAQLSAWMNPCPWPIWDTVPLQIRVLEKLGEH